MKEDEFDAIFRSKIEAEDSEPIWDEAKVWNKIRPVQDKKRVVYWPYAASIAMVIAVSIFMLFSEKTKIEKPILVEIKKVDSDKKETKMVDNQMIVSGIKVKQQTISNEKEIIEIAATPFIKTIVEEEKTLEVSIKNEAVLVEKKLDNQPIVLPFEEKEALVLEQKKEIKNHTITLNIPVENEDKSVRKKRVVGRFFQQVGRYSNGEKFNWEEINIRPKAIWSYLKNSFTVDSTVVTSGRF
jgi:hypothetical protein